jgi:hypothetical protein
MTKLGIPLFRLISIQPSFVEVLSLLVNIYALFHFYLLLSLDLQIVERIRNKLQKEEEISAKNNGDLNSEQV